MSDIDTESEREMLEAIDELKAIQPTNIDHVREIVTNHSMNTFYWGNKSNKVLVDVLTANVICTIYDNVRDDLKERLLTDLVTSRDSFIRLTNLCWKVIK